MMSSVGFFSSQGHAVAEFLILAAVNFGKEELEVLVCEGNIPSLSCVNLAMMFC